MLHSFWRKPHTKGDANKPYYYTWMNKGPSKRDPNRRPTNTNQPIISIMITDRSPRCIAKNRQETPIARYQVLVHLKRQKNHAQCDY